MTPPDLPKLDLTHLRSWIDREDSATDVITLDLVRKFGATFDLSMETLVEGDLAPLLIHYCLAQPAASTSELGEDGHPQRGGFLPPVPLPRRMWAGSRLVFTGQLCVGDRVRRLSRIADVSVKEGRSGVLCFVTVEHAFEVEGKLIVREIQDIVYREANAVAPSREPAKTAVAAAAGDHHRDVDPSSPLLFRYSALTFNSHRIHYDRRYAMDVEHYLGLVVHGPLQATLLISFASAIKNRAPDEFAFRSLTPLYDDAALQLHASDDGSLLRLWTSRRGGPVAMAAEAVWA